MVWHGDASSNHLIAALITQMARWLAAAGLRREPSDGRGEDLL